MELLSLLLSLPAPPAAGWFCIAGAVVMPLDAAELVMYRMYCSKPEHAAVGGTEDALHCLDSLASRIQRTGPRS